MLQRCIAVVAACCSNTKVVQFKCHSLLRSMYKTLRVRIKLVFTSNPSSCLGPYSERGELFICRLTKADNPQVEVLFNMRQAATQLCDTESVTRTCRKRVLFFFLAL